MKVRQILRCVELSIAKLQSQVEELKKLDPNKEIVMYGDLDQGGYSDPQEIKMFVVSKFEFEHVVEDNMHVGTIEFSFEDELHPKLMKEINK